MLMNRKNVFRTLTVIAVVLLLGWVFFYLNDDTRGFKQVDTSVAVSQINGDNVKMAQIDDREQQVRLELKTAKPEAANSTKVIAKYPTGPMIGIPGVPDSLPVAAGTMSAWAGMSTSAGRT